MYLQKNMVPSPVHLIGVPCFQVQDDPSPLFSVWTNLSQVTVSRRKMTLGFRTLQSPRYFRLILSRVRGLLRLSVHINTLGPEITPFFFFF